MIPPWVMRSRAGQSRPIRILQSKIAWIAFMHPVILQGLQINQLLNLNFIIIILLYDISAPEGFSSGIKLKLLTLTCNRHCQCCSARNLYTSNVLYNRCRVISGLSYLPCFRSRFCSSLVHSLTVSFTHVWVCSIRAIHAQ